MRGKEHTVEDMRIIRVTGRGQMKLRPDTTEITMTISGVYREYADALEHSASDTETLRDALVPFGFARTDLKTLQFGVEPEYESYQDQGVYRSRFAGYRFRHVLKVRFASDNALLGKVLYALAHSAAEPELQIGYTVRDTEAAKNLLLEKAVADAKAKAEVLSKAAGVTLKAIRSIDYSWGSMEFAVRPMSRMLCDAESCNDSVDLDIEPNDIEANDTVTVVWEIA